MWIFRLWYKVFRMNITTNTLRHAFLFRSLQTKCSFEFCPLSGHVSYFKTYAWIGCASLKWQKKKEFWLRELTGKCSLHYLFLFSCYVRKCLYNSYWGNTPLCRKRKQFITTSHLSHIRWNIPVSNDHSNLITHRFYFRVLLNFSLNHFAWVSEIMHLKNLHHFWKALEMLTLLKEHMQNDTASKCSVCFRIGNYIHAWKVSFQ